MAQDRVIIVRIAGIGFEADKAYPLTLTSRPLTYLQSTAVQGVVTELSAQFSSEIPLFGTLGSDPTTSFSVLANTQTLSVLMSRGAAQVRDVNEGSIQTTSYVIPDPNASIDLTDSSTINAGDIIRINGLAYHVTSSTASTPGSINVEMAYGSVPQPIPVRLVGQQVSGSTVYASYWQGTNYPTGGAEQQPVTISTVPIGAVDASEEEVIFRGVVSRVNIDTSAGTANQIRVECMSLMGVIRNAPWAPAPAGVYFEGTPGFDEDRYYDEHPDNLIGPGGSRFSGALVAYPNVNVSGPIFEESGKQYATRYGTMQLRSDKFGGVTSVIAASPATVTLSARPVDPELNDLRAVGFNLVFNDGYYRRYNGDSSEDLNIALSESARSRIRNMRDRFSNDPVSLQLDQSWQAEIAFTGQSFQSVIIDLIFGTYNTDPIGRDGVRPWGMAAWIPFSALALSDVIDLGSLNTAFNMAQMSTDIPLMNAWESLTSTQLPNTCVLPVKPDGPKTVGEVLDNLLKNLALFMVYDRGRISFGRWASENPWPVPVTDADFAEPKISLNYDRVNSIQSVSVEYPATITADDLNITSNPIANVERIINGAGKTMTVGSMMQQGHDYQAGLIGSFAFLNGTSLVTRYSQSAAIVEVTLRDETKDLSIGQYVALTSAFLPNGAGSMGVANATGIVIKAVRSWMTPTSSYTLFLPGYLFATNRVSTLSCSARVVSVPSSGVVEIATNDFTDPYPQVGSPATDAAAFEQTLQRVTGSPKSFFCELFDEFGTPYGISARLIAVGSATLQFNSGAFDGAVAGDIILMSTAGSAFVSYPDDLKACWDAYQGDAVGIVNASTDFSYPWSR